MQAFAIQFGLVALVVTACVTGPVIGAFFLTRRKRLARARRRSPIGINLLRGPGHTLREQLDESTVDLAMDLTLLIVLPLMVLTVFFGHSQLLGLPRTLKLAPVYLVFAVGCIAFVVVKLLRAGERLDKLKAGYDAELAVGQELDQLMRQGAAVFHDVPGENFNIDHVVVASSGVFAVETKGFTKLNRGRGKADATVVFDGESLSFPTWTTREPLEQSERQAKWLANWLSRAVAEDIGVQPVLALPGWWVERSQRSAVLVLSGKELPWLLKKQGVAPLTADQAQRVAHQVEQRCRTVAPRYREDSKKAA